MTHKTTPADTATIPSASANVAAVVAAVALMSLEELQALVLKLQSQLATCATIDALSASHKRIDDLADQVAKVGKSLTATSKTVAAIARDPKDKPRTLSEAIQSVKADGCDLDGQALRDHAIRTHPHVAPKHAKKLAAQDAAAKAAAKANKA